MRKTWVFLILNRGKFSKKRSKLQWFELVITGVYLVSSQNRYMKARIKTQITINADAATVFKYLSHTKYHHLWNPQIQAVSPLVQLRAGMVYSVQTLVLGVRTKATNHITKYTQDKELGIQNETGMVQYSAEFHLEQHDKSTLVVCTVKVSTQAKAFAFTKPIMEHLARRELRTDLAALKEAVEQKL
jgi:hypothetical protein